jgi:hypothetical protein
MPIIQLADTQPSISTSNCNNVRLCYNKCSFSIQVQNTGKELKELGVNAAQ